MESKEITAIADRISDKLIAIVKKQLGEPQAQPAPRWVKCSDRLPGYKLRVKWRDGNDHSYATDGEISMFEMEKPNLEGWEWLDEQPEAVKQIDREWLCDILIEFTIAYVKSTNKDIANDAAEYIYDKLKDAGIEYVLSESEQPAAGREEDACDFAEWMRLNCKSSQNGWVDALGKWDTTKGWYELFKQQKEK